VAGLRAGSLLLSGGFEYEGTAAGCVLGVELMLSCAYPLPSSGFEPDGLAAVCLLANMGVGVRCFLRACIAAETFCSTVLAIAAIALAVGFLIRPDEVIPNTTLGSDAAEVTLLAAVLRFSEAVGVSRMVSEVLRMVVAKLLRRRG